MAIDWVCWPEGAVATSFLADFKVCAAVGFKGDWREISRPREALCYAEMIESKTGSVSNQLGRLWPISTL